MELEQIVEGLSQYSCLGVFATAVSVGASYWFDNFVRYISEFATESLKRRNMNADTSLVRSLWYHVGDLALPLTFGGIVSVVDYLKEQDPLLALATGGAFAALVAVPQQIIKYSNSFLRNRRTLNETERMAFGVLHRELKESIAEFDLATYMKAKQALEKYISEVSHKKRSVRLISNLHEELRNDLEEGDTKHFTWTNQYRIILSALAAVKQPKMVYSLAFNDLMTLKPKLVAPYGDGTPSKYTKTDVIIIYKDDYRFIKANTPGQKAEKVEGNPNPVYAYKFEPDDLGQSIEDIQAKLDLEQKEDWTDEEQLVDLVRQYGNGANLLLVAVGHETPLDEVKAHIAHSIYDINQLHRGCN